MLFFLGMLGFFQATILPGVLIYKFWKIKSDFLETLVMSFGLSIVFNYVMVLALVSLGIYDQGLLLGLIFFEIVGLLYIFRNFRFNLDVMKLVEGFNNRQQVTEIFGRVIIILTVVYSILKLANGDIFTSWDSVASWNHWAILWSQGNFVAKMGNYPQLLPSIWSITYKVMGGGEATKLQFFAVNIYHIFLVFASLMLYCLYKRDETMAVFIAILGFIGVIFNRSTIFFDGYADLPVAVICFLSVCCLLFATQKGISAYNSFKYLFLGAVFVTAGAVTKQAGLFWAAGYFISVIYYQYIGLVPKEVNKRLLWMLMLLMFVIIVSPWYIYTRYMMAIGKNFSEVYHVTEQIHEGRTYLQRMIRAFAQWPNMIIMIILALPALFTDRYRTISFFGIFYVLLWASLLSYDRRNSSIGIPLLFVAIAGYWSSFLIKTINFLQGNGQKLQQINKIPVALFMILGLGSLFVSSLIFMPDYRMFRRQYNLQIAIGNQDSNMKILDIVKNEGSNTLFISEAHIVGYLPDFYGKHMNYYLDGNFSNYINQARQSGAENIYILLNEEHQSIFNKYLEGNRQIKTQVQGVYGGYVFNKILFN